MNVKQKWIIALAVVAVLAGLVLPVCRYQEQEIETADIRRRMAFDAVDDSYVYGGADIIWYSDNHSTEKATIDGAVGNASFDGTLTVGSQATLSNGLALTGNITMTGSAASMTVSGDLDVGGNIKSTSGSVRINDTVLVTGTLGVSSQVSADGLYSTNAITTTGNATVVGLTVSGNVADSGTLFRVNDNAVVSGSLTATGKGTFDNLAVTQNLTVTGSASYTSLTIAEPMQDSGTTFRIADPLSVTGTLAVEGPVSDHGTILRLEDNTLVTGTLGVSSQVSADGLYSTNAITTTSNATVVGLTVSGNVADSGTLLRINDNSVITGSLGVSGQVTADGFKSTNAISSTGVLTVTNWGTFYGVALLPGYTVAITTNGAINPTGYSLVLLSDNGAQATGNITLNATTSINDGTYIGQLLMIKFVDADGAGMIIKNAANTKLPAAGDMTLTVNDVVVLFWDGTDWVCVSKSDN